MKIVVQLEDGRMFETVAKSSHTLDAVRDPYSMRLDLSDTKPLGTASPCRPMAWSVGILHWIQHPPRSLSPSNQWGLAAQPPTGRG